MHNEIEYVFNLLENHRLKEALVQIHAMASQCSSWQLRTRRNTANDIRSDVAIQRKGHKRSQTKGYV